LCFCSLLQANANASQLTAAIAASEASLAASRQAEAELKAQLHDAKQALASKQTELDVLGEESRASLAAAKARSNALGEEGAELKWQVEAAAVRRGQLERELADSAAEVERWRTCHSAEAEAHAAAQRLASERGTKVSELDLALDTSKQVGGPHWRLLGWCAHSPADCQSASARVCANKVWCLIGVHLEQSMASTPEIEGTCAVFVCVMLSGCEPVGGAAG